MYQLHVMGTAPASLSTALGSIKHVPELCRLIYEQTPYDVRDETPGYAGDLVAAPPGLYYLWVSKPSEPLMITSDKIIVGRSVLLTRESVDKLERKLPDRVKKAFSELYATSEKQVRVYQHTSGNQEYRLRYPEDVIDQYLDGKNDSYVYIGVADLKTGMIR